MIDAMDTDPAVAPGSVRPAFDTSNILWFFGAYTATVAALVVIGQTGSGARGLWILLAALAFIAAYSVVAWWLLRLGWTIPGGVLAAMAIVFVPVAGGAFERLIGVLPSFRNGSSAAALPVGVVTVPAPTSPFDEFSGWIFVLPLVTIAAGIGAYALVRFPFVFFVVASAALIATQLLAPAFSSHLSGSGHATAFLIGGLVLVAAGIALDVRGERRAAFWWHFFGLSAVAVGLTYHAVAHSSRGWILIFAAGIAVLAGALLLGRATWAVFAVAGAYAPVVHYLASWFGNLGTAFALLLTGLVLVALGVAARAFADTRSGLSARRAAA
jgi:hypothetical protein